MLVARGFTVAGARWRGRLGGFACTVELTEAFPFVLPEIRLDRSLHREIIAHVDAKGVVCFADSTNILIDAANPDGLVDQSLDKASAILRAGEAKAEDIAEEFSAYWEAESEVCSVCDLTSAPHTIAIAKRAKPKPWYVAADSGEHLNEWLKHRGMPGTDAFFNGLIVPLGSAPIELLRPTSLRVRHLCRAIRTLVAPDARVAVEALLKRGDIPALVVLTFPLKGGHVGAVGVIVRRPTNLPGVYGRRVKVADILRFALGEAVERVSIARADAEYLLPRGGASIAVRRKAALMVGCGAVGGWVAQLLATTGLGTLEIVDSDTLSRDNVHRHALGMESVGWNKAEAMALRLQRQFPHQQVRARAQDFVKLLLDDQVDIDLMDFLILATGNETLELRLNAMLRRRVQLVHVWLDPFDLGFHVFVDGHAKPGCFRCLFGRDEREGLFNRASFLRRGQPVTKSLAGCSGNFAPYTVGHALSAAMVAVETAMVIDPSNGAILESRLCSSAAALKAGMELSKRAGHFRPGEAQRTNSWGFVGCEVCGAE